MLAHVFFGLLIKKGSLQVTDTRGRVKVHGDGSTAQVAIRLHDRVLEAKILLQPKLYIGEGYMDGGLSIEQGRLYDFMEICAVNSLHFERHPAWAPIRWIELLLGPLRFFNPRWRARKNVAHHYDLSGELYDLFLDPDRQYSCAYFDRPELSLEAAQRRKKEHIAAKLLLDRPGLRILDIGSGWGGLGIYLAELAGAQVTGVTLSREQHQHSNARVAQAGLEESVSFELRDYRQQEGQFDRIVSVGMFEHVGPPQYRNFFRKIKQSLSDDGVALLHTIGRYDPPGGMNPWITKYIFPGGYIPALSEIMTEIEKECLYVTDIEVLRLHYAETLHHWRRLFDANRERAQAIYDERFCRMWDFYLIAAELSFRHLGEVVFQIQIAKDQAAVPLTRDYITDWERAQNRSQSHAAE